MLPKCNMFSQISLRFTKNAAIFFLIYYLYIKIFYGFYLNKAQTKMISKNKRTRLHVYEVTPNC